LLNLSNGEPIDIPVDSGKLILSFQRAN